MGGRQAGDRWETDGRRAGDKQETDLREVDAGVLRSVRGLELAREVGVLRGDLHLLRCERLFPGEAELGVWGFEVQG